MNVLLFESVRVKGEITYSKTVNFFRKSDFLPLGSDFYKKGKLHKSLRNLNIKEVSGFLTPMKVEMTMNGSKDKTVMKVEVVRYGVKIAPSTFYKQAL